MSRALGGTEKTFSPIACDKPSSVGLVCGCVGDLLETNLRSGVHIFFLTAKNEIGTPDCRLAGNYMVYPHVKNLVYSR